MAVHNRLPETIKKVSGVRCVLYLINDVLYCIHFWGRSIQYPIECRFSIQTSDVKSLTDQ